MTSKISITPDTPDSRKKLLIAVAEVIEGSNSVDPSDIEDGEIDFKYREGAGRPVVAVNFRGNTLYLPYLATFKDAAAKVRSDVAVRLQLDQVL